MGRRCIKCNEYRLDKEFNGKKRWWGINYSNYCDKCSKSATIRFFIFAPIFLIIGSLMILILINHDPDRKSRAEIKEDNYNICKSNCKYDYKNNTADEKGIKVVQYSRCLKACDYKYYPKKQQSNNDKIDYSLLLLLVI